MRIPYALHDFKRLRTNGFLYVDKTKYIESLERINDYVLFLRPRRFGKTLFTSVLTYYYDTLYENEFEVLFGSLYIGKHKTTMANGYHVLNLDFSGIDSRKENVENSFYRKIKARVNNFIAEHRLPIKLDHEINRANDFMETFLADYKACSDRKMFIIIDEYDHFANNILTDDVEYFNDITSKDGFVRNFYEVLKAYAGNVIERMFITGVTPITLDALTSGFNIAKNIGNRKDFNEMIGFTEEEVLAILKQCDISGTMIHMLKSYYNGYLFHRNALNKVYNSNLLMYFLSEYQDNGQAPEQYVDSNVISDYRKITSLFDLYNDKQHKIEMIENIVSENPLSGVIMDRIGPLAEKGYLNEGDFISLLYYLGLLTISDSNGESISFATPNYCIRSIYAQYYLSYIYSQMNQEYNIGVITSAIDALILRNDISPYKALIECLLKGLTSYDFIRFDEKHVQLLMYSIVMNSITYLVKTEYEMEGGQRADLVLLPNYSRTADFYYVFEIKYIKKGDYEKNPSLLQDAREHAIIQVNQYAGTKELSQVPNLKKYVVVAVKDEIKVFSEVS